MFEETPNPSRLTPADEIISNLGEYFMSASICVAARLEQDTAIRSCSKIAPGGHSHANHKLRKTGYKSKRVAIFVQY